MHIDKEFFHSGDGVYYSFFIEYVSKKKRESNPARDLTEEQTEQYNRLRDWRNELAANEGLPAYIILYNSQIAEIVKLQPDSLEAMQSIKGLKAKLDKYGKDILKVLHSGSGNGE